MFLTRPVAEYLIAQNLNLKISSITGLPAELGYAFGFIKATGFNTALLAEIGKHLGCNIEIMQVYSAERVTALTSGRADVVFWFSMWAFTEAFSGREQPDLTSDVIVSAPYYTTDMAFKAAKK